VPDAADAYAIARPRPIESLRGQSNAPRLGQRQMFRHQ